MTAAYDGWLRRSGLWLDTQPAVNTTWGYDAAGRLETVSQGGATVAYQYVANSLLVGHIAFALNAQPRMSTSKEYDRASRLVGIRSVPQGPGADGRALGAHYGYNAAGQRIRASLPDGSYWLYTYDRLGQVISGKRYWQDGTPVAGQQFEYSFDDIGNRKETRAGGDGAGLNLRPASYSASALNQYTSRGVPGFVDIMGVANPGGAVTVNGHAALRQGEYFHHALAVANSSQPWHGTVQVSSAYPPGAVESGAVFVPRTPESFSHDADGNLTHDGQWVYTWDAENRLVRMVSANTNPAVGPQQRIEFGYDWHGRRISKRVWNNTSGTGAPALDLKFVYDLSAGPAGGVEFAGHSGFSLQPSEFVCVGSGFERHDGRGGGRGRFAVRDRAYGSECGNLFLRV